MKPDKNFIKHSQQQYIKAKEIRLVIFSYYTEPEILKSWVHITGRTGRSGRYFHRNLFDTTRSRKIVRCVDKDKKILELFKKTETRKDFHGWCESCCVPKVKEDIKTRRLKRYINNLK